MRVIIRGSWAPYVGTDYCDALGIYDSLEDAASDADCYAWERWEGEEDEDSSFEDEDSGFEDEGPDYWIEEYDPDKHDMFRAGGGSFLDDAAFSMIGYKGGSPLDDYPVEAIEREVFNGYN